MKPQEPEKTLHMMVDMLNCKTLKLIMKNHDFNYQKLSLPVKSMPTILCY